MQIPNWIFAGVFADDGRSAPQYRRDDFNQLMDQCLKEGGHGVTKPSAGLPEYGGLHLLGEAHERTWPWHFEKELAPWTLNRRNDADHPEQPGTGGKPCHQHQRQVGYAESLKRGIHKDEKRWIQKAPTERCIVEEEAAVIRNMARWFLDGTAWNESSTDREAQE